MELTKTHSDTEKVWTNLDPTAPPFDYLSYYKAGKLQMPTHEQLLAEVQLLSLGNIFPLNIKIDLQQLSGELEKYKNDWSDYLPRPGRVNNRQALSLVGLPGGTINDNLSIPEARVLTGRELMDADFTTPTELFHHCKSLHPFLNYFMPLARTFFVKSNAGGWFAPHRDGRWLFRDTFRLIAFCGNCQPDQYDWMLNGEKIHFEEGRVYYINTRMDHRTISYIDGSLHLIVNIPVTLENVLKVLNYC